MLLDLAHEKLGWPSRNEILKPPGEGVRVFADLAKAKIGDALARQPGGPNAHIGVVASNPNTSATEPPLAVVCEFRESVSDQTLRDLQRLAWNFSKCPMLVTVEPQMLRAWTCCEPPSDRLLTEYLVHELSSSDLTSGISQRATQVLRWINLVSGQFFRENSALFRRNRRADRMLLENLRFVRQELHNRGLVNDDICHDLLARVIFIQFLFDRKDSSGKSALNEGMLERLHLKGVLRGKHYTFASILSNYDECYKFFSHLNTQFNGDLFPSKGNTNKEREQAWQAEKQHVKQEHLNVLRDLVGGDLHMPTRQLCLWREYAFDVIPLEFISSIYEAFVNERARESGIYYTPPHLVDFILDRVLPWDNDQWDLKVLDPACGSGVFLVKAFQRLLYRWKRAHPDETIRAETLRRLLENNLFGVDNDPHAVRVASFSLYLAMCDEIDPRYYWTQVKFPPMRGRRLIKADFFDESKEGFRTDLDAGSFDLVFGNAPWGGTLETERSKDWASKHDWPIAERDIGPLFVPKAAALTKPDGRVCMLQPARVLLFNQRGPARTFRKKLFSTYKVEEVVNFSALRFELFEQAVDPVCAITLSPEAPTNDRISYVCPKLTQTSNDNWQIVTHPLDAHFIYPLDAATDPFVWSAFTWGRRRDFVLLRRLCRFESLEKLEKSGAVKIRRGISRGDRGKRQVQIAGKRIMEANEFPEGTFLRLKAQALPINRDLYTHSKDSTDFSAFALPQLILKQSWLKGHFRFQAAVVDSDMKTGAALCSRSYSSVHSPAGSQELLEAVCVSLRSKLAVYHLLLTSGRFASYREEPNLEDILRVPIPNIRAGLLQGISNFDDLDSRVRNCFGFKDAEWVLIEDLFNITLADFKGDANSPGRNRTQRNNKEVEEPQLRDYCEYFTRVIKAGFGDDKRISATIFQEKRTDDLLPFRLVAFQLDHATFPSLQVEKLETLDLLTELENLNKTWLKSAKANSGNIYHQRVARIYDIRDNIPTIFIIKPDAYQYWTRSSGLHDADEVAADFIQWRGAALSGGIGGH